MKAFISSPYFESALMLPFLVDEVLREKDYYHAHGRFSLAPILLVRRVIGVMEAAEKSSKSGQAKLVPYE